MGTADSGVTRCRNAATAAQIAAAMLFVACWLSGCMVGPEYARPETRVAGQWRDSADPHVIRDKPFDSQWWKAFNDPVLDELEQLACEQNLPLQIAGLRILEARAQLGIAVGLQYPQQQQAFGNVSGVGLSQNAPNGRALDRSFYDYQLGFDAEWELDFWGRFRRNVQAADAAWSASLADYDNALVSLTAEVARTYTEFRTREVLIELAFQNIAVQEGGLRMAESRFVNGATTELDVTQARTLLESTRATVPELQARLIQAQNALSTLVGRPPGAMDALLAQPAPIPKAPPDVIVGVPADLLRRRPDIRSAELQAAAQAARIGVAEADLYPAFSLFGQIGFETSSNAGGPFGGARAANIFDGNSLFYSYGPAARWPILNYGRLRNNVRVQDARFQQLLVNYQNTVLSAAQEVEDAVTGFLRSQEAAAYAQAAVDAAQRSVDLATAQYREGAVDYQRVLDTQRSLLQEQNRLAETQSAIATNWIAVYKALGGGWECRQGQPIIPQDMQAEMRDRTAWGDLLPPMTPETLEPTSDKDIPLIQRPDW